MSPELQVDLTMFADAILAVSLETLARLEALGDDEAAIRTLVAELRSSTDPVERIVGRYVAAELER